MQGTGYRQRGRPNSSAGLGVRAPGGSRERRRHPAPLQDPRRCPCGRGTRAGPSLPPGTTPQTTPASRTHARTRARRHALTHAPRARTCTHLCLRTHAPRPLGDQGLTWDRRQWTDSLRGGWTAPPPGHPWPWSPSSCGARATGLPRGALPWPSPGSVPPARPEAGSPDAPLTSPSSQVPVWPD